MTIEDVRLAWNNAEVNLINDYTIVFSRQFQLENPEIWDRLYSDFEVKRKAIYNRFSAWCDELEPHVELVG